MIMKNGLLLLLFACCLLNGGCKRNPAANTKHEQEEPYFAARMLYEFYQSYLTEILENETDNNRVDSILNEYVSKELLAKLKSLELDFNPFVNVQGSDKNWLKKLLIDQVDSINGVYTVHFSDTHHVLLQVSKENGKYRIADILFPDINLVENVVMEDSVSLIGGKWQMEGGNDKAVLEFLDKSSASLEIYTQPDEAALFFVNLTETRGELLLKFEGLSAMSRYNTDLDWFSLSKDSTIAVVKIAGSRNITLKWLGFYNFKTKKREFMNNPFDKNSNVVTLKRYRYKEEEEVQ